MLMKAERRCPTCGSRLVLADNGRVELHIKPLTRFRLPGMPRPFPSLLIGVTIGMALMWIFENGGEIYLYFTGVW